MESVFSFYLYVGSRDQTKVARFTRKYLYPLSHCASPILFFEMQSRLASDSDSPDPT